MLMQKQEIKGKLGESVVYHIEDLHFNREERKLEWSHFRFYSPIGTETDEQGFNYFDVPADSIPVERDNTLDKFMIVIVTLDRGVEVLEIFDGAEMDTVTIGLEGDFIISTFIPADVNREIIVNYKEVTGG